MHGKWEKERINTQERLGCYGRFYSNIRGLVVEFPMLRQASVDNALMNTHQYGFQNNGSILVIALRFVVKKKKQQQHFVVFVLF